jgi:hypothetical protein
LGSGFLKIGIIVGVAIQVSSLVSPLIENDIFPSLTTDPSGFMPTGATANLVLLFIGETAHRPV